MTRRRRRSGGRPRPVGRHGAALRRAVTGAGRWVRPGRAATTILLGAWLALAALTAWTGHRFLRSRDPAATLALAASVLPDPPSLDSTLAVTWNRSVAGTAQLEERWRGLVRPGIPPGMCPAGPSPGAPAADGGDLASAVRRLDAAVRRGDGRDEIERLLLAVRAAGPFPDGSREDLVQRYSLARGYLAAGDAANASTVLEPVVRGGTGAVPDVTAERARQEVDAGRVDRRLASEAFHARYLAGVLALERGAAEEAVVWFRRAINAVHYLLALEGGTALGGATHERRVSVPLGGAACPGTDPDGALTSLDAYAGLVAAYMAADGFRDERGARGLPLEVARSRLEMDAGDPFAPVLAHARVTGGDPRRSPVPENLLWAASNLQRVYHHNRLRPDPRLEVTRAVLLLHLTGRAEWMEALTRDGAADRCAMLGTVADDLHRDAAAMEAGQAGYTPADSARAAVAVQAFARLEGECEGREVPAVDGRIRSAWIRLGGGHLTTGLGSTLEELRMEIRQAMASPGASPAVLQDRLATPVARVRRYRDVLGRGRLPEELPASLAAEDAGRLVEAWWEALFLDVARALADAARAPGREGVPAGRAGELLTALESSVAHAGLRPDHLYAPGEMAPLARAAGGGAGEWKYRLRHRVRSRPLAAIATGAALLGAACLAALWLHVAAWRYRVVTRQRLFADEYRFRRRRAA